MLYKRWKAILVVTGIVVEAPFVQNPSKTQHFNRYCYAHGNPLIYTDPDGNNPVFIAMAIGFALMQADISGKKAQEYGQSYWSGFGSSIGNSAISMIAGAGFGSISSIWTVGIIPSAIAGGIGGSLGGGFASMMTGGNFWQGALYGGITGMVFGGINGGINASKLGLNVWTGTGVSKSLIGTPILGNDGEFDFSKYKGHTQEELKRLARELHIDPDESRVVKLSDTEFPKGYYLERDGALYDSKGDGMYGFTVHKWFLKSEIYISPLASSNPLLLREILGHELTHAWVYRFESTFGMVNSDYSEHSAYRVSAKILETYKHLDIKTYIDRYTELFSPRNGLFVRFPQYKYGRLNVPPFYR